MTTLDPMCFFCLLLAFVLAILLFLLYYFQRRKHKIITKKLIGVLEQHSGEKLQAGGAALNEESLPQHFHRILQEKEGQVDLFWNLLSSLEEGILCVNQKGYIVFQNPSLHSRILPANSKGKLYYKVVRNADLLEYMLRVLDQKDFLSPYFDSKALESPQVKLGRRLYRLRFRKVSGFGKDSLYLFVLSDQSSELRFREERQEFLEYASHELKTPVTSILGYAHTLLDRAENSMQKQFLERIIRNSKRMQDLIEDMVSIASMESGAYPLHIEALMMEDVLASLMGLIEETLRKKEQRFQVSIVSQKPVYADALLLEHLLVNLITNASRYSPEKSRIDFRYRIEDGFPQIEVEDEGIGIEEQHRKRIFRRFYRVDRMRSRKEGGTGLGLSIVRHIVRLHKGRVWVESRSDGKRGTVFKVRFRPDLPAAQGPTRKL